MITQIYTHTHIHPDWTSHLKLIRCIFFYYFDAYFNPNKSSAQNSGKLQPLFAMPRGFYAKIFSSRRFFVTTVPGLCCASGWFSNSAGQVDTGLLIMHCFRS